MPDFRLVADFEPTGDQPTAIEGLVDGLERGLRHQTLLGATGTGKSLAADEPILIGRKDAVGDVSWKLTPIGPLIDRILSERRSFVDDHGTEVVFGDRASPEYVVATIDPSSHKTVIKPVTAISRHTTPDVLYRVRTMDGRAVTVTGDHNFVRLGPEPGRLENVRTTHLHAGDMLPLPARLPEPTSPRRKVDVAIDLADSAANFYVSKRSNDAVLHSKRPSGFDLRTPISNGAAIATLERTREGVVVGRHGPHGLPISFPLTKSWLSFLGLFIAEGHVADRYATITPGPENIELVRELTKEIGVATFERGRDELGIGSRVVTEGLRKWCGERAGGKHLPEFWPNLDNAMLGQLLAGYFDGDGWIEKRGVAICVTTKSERLASELGYALMRFGIIARLTRVWKRAVGSSHKGDWYWTCSIRGAEDIRAFANEIGFLSTRKRAAVARIAEFSVGGNSDVLPAETGRFIRQARMALGVYEREVATLMGVNRTGLDMIENGRRALRRGTAAAALQALENIAVERGLQEDAAYSEAATTLSRLLACRWTRVASIEPVAPKTPHVYDLSVEGAETFLGGFGGLVVHNTFSIAKVIEKVNRPTLVLAHNKTLAAQLYSEFRSFFPDNAVEYFVSYFDYYQPEAYLPRSDTYIEKDSSRNDEIDKLRHAATHALFERRDVIIVASVSCIYGLGAPVDYGATVLRLKKGGKYRRDAVLRQLVDLQYQRNDQALTRAKFRVRGDTLELVPASEDQITRVEFFGDEVERITEVDALTGELLSTREELNVYPATHFVTPADKLDDALVNIEAEMETRVGELEAAGRVLEAARLRQRTTFDLEMLRELGFCSGVENYSRHLSGRAAGSRPWTLLDYFPPDWLLVVDESHMSIPQAVGMYKNDRTRKEILVDFGFRLPSALDNRPLTFEELEDTVRQAIYMSATPGPYELANSEQVVEQLIRPTGVVDPLISVRPTKEQVDDLLDEIRTRVEKHERVIITTLTKKMAEDLTDYLRELDVKVQYLHSEVDTLDRIQILRDLRLGVYDVLVGINLLREGIDLPEVTLVAILDADKEGFLRSAWSLVQVIGRAARNTEGRVLMYADQVTESMRVAIEETDRRRAAQQAYNTEHGIEPTTIIREIHDLNERLRATTVSEEEFSAPGELSPRSRSEVERLVAQIEAEMKAAARNLEFERAAALRDEIQQIRLHVLEDDASVQVARAAETAGKKSRRPALGAGRLEAERLAMEVTSVVVLPAEEEPGDTLDAEPLGPAEGTAADWLPGLRDEHEEGGATARSEAFDRPTWDHTITPNVVKRQGARPPRRGEKKGSARRRRG